ncbi:hypothetical protein [Bradyrhizobium cenepequi]|uniref:hypothetical protein n=1 Tax=Bradyrhizobium cenepequi TaxID=2821403 RepID=UPI001CE3646C|nr:hypothetical protein [Bradyrhizobium cenepequi]MCA6113088.1 hypothetical protein [Bradyrhizobium cenepequi]
MDDGDGDLREVIFGSDGKQVGGGARQLAAGKNGPDFLRKTATLNGKQALSADNGGRWAAPSLGFDSDPARLQVVMHGVDEVHVHIFVEITSDAYLDSRPSRLLSGSAQHPFSVDREDQSCCGCEVRKR